MGVAIRCWSAKMWKALEHWLRLAGVGTTGGFGLGFLELVSTATACNSCRPKAVTTCCALHVPTWFVMRPGVASLQWLHAQLMTGL